MTPAAPDDHFADLLDERLRRRLTEAIAGAPGHGQRGTPPEPSASLLRDCIEELVEQLAAREDDGATEALQAAHELGLAQLKRRFESRVAALDQVQEAITRLRQITSPTAMLAAAAKELSHGSELDRVLLSVVRDGVMVPEAAYFRGDPSGAKLALEALRARPIRLEHPLLETDLVRRRRATVVADARVHPRVDRFMTEVMNWTSYVAAPVAVRSSVVAVIHADRGPSVPLDVLHRDVLWEFAAGLAQAYESASLRRTLRHEREQMRHFLQWLDARSSELTDSAIELAPRDLPPLPPPEPLDAATGRSGLDDASVFVGVLTRRELEVLRLLSDGRTNRAIADELVISHGTVKFHVNSILRKLRVANRAEAVSRYYALLGAGRRGPGLA